MKTLALAAAAALMVLAVRRAQASAPTLIYWDSTEQPDEPDQLPTWLETLELSMDPSTYTSGTLPGDLADVNVRAFLAMIRSAEGTDRAADPYRVVMGYGHTIADLSDHPYFTGEWVGASFQYRSPIDGTTRTAWSTAAGAYQFIRKTWGALRDQLQLPDFGPASQDAAALELISQRGALADVRAGRFAAAVAKCAPTWASLPGAGYGQSERTLDRLQSAFTAAGGTVTA